jgi:hypothetical protein
MKKRNRVLSLLGGFLSCSILLPSTSYAAPIGPTLPPPIEEPVVTTTVVDESGIISKTMEVDGVQFVYHMTEDEPITQEMKDSAVQYVNGAKLEAFLADPSMTSEESFQTGPALSEEQQNAPINDEPPSYVDPGCGTGCGQVGVTRHDSFSTYNVAAVKSQLFITAEAIAYSVTANKSYSDGAKAVIYVAAGAAAIFVGDYVQVDYTMSKMFKEYSSYYGKNLYDVYYNTYWTRTKNSSGQYVYSNLKRVDIVQNMTLRDRTFYNLYGK